jgi:prepilin-type N-terminal cleavage/methylation domain-containing protein
MYNKGYTLIEVVMVMIIVWLILSMTVFFWSEYLKELQLRKEKEEVINIINYATSYVKSSNYYNGEKFSHLIVDIATGGITISLDSSTWTWFSSYDLLRSEISFFTLPASNQVRLTPYQRECEDTVNSTGDITFQLLSTVNDQEFCFSRNMALCKLFIISCP